MNEPDRYTYLQAMGIETYVLRSHVSEETHQSQEINKQEETSQSVITHFSITTLLDKTLDEHATPANKIEIKKEEIQHPKQIEKTSSFSLSIWRPLAGILIIDSRNVALALPTEILLNNMLRAYFNHSNFLLNEEVFQWPMLGIKHNINQGDARAELQTWLSVEHEQRPIQALWLMGEAAAQNWLPNDVDYAALVWTQQRLEELNLSALILPSLNEFLQQPLYKSKLWNSLTNK
jgi:hypothetical protein